MMATGFINPPKSNQEYDRRYYTGLTKKMKHSYSTSHILDKRTLGDFPLLLSTPSSYEKKFSSFSEKERNEKNILALLKLKHFLNQVKKKVKNTHHILDYIIPLVDIYFHFWLEYLLIQRNK